MPVLGQYLPAVGAAPITDPRFIHPNDKAPGGMRLVCTGAGVWGADNGNSILYFQQTAATDAACLVSDSIGFFDLTFTVKRNTTGSCNVFTYVNKQFDPVGAANPNAWDILVWHDTSNVYVQHRLSGNTRFTDATVVSASPTGFTVQVVRHLGTITIKVTPAGGATTTVTLNQNAFTINTYAGLHKFIIGPTGFDTTVGKIGVSSVKLIRNPQDSLEAFTQQSPLARPIVTGKAFTDAIMASALENMRFQMADPSGSLTRGIFNAAGQPYNGFYTWDTYWATLTAREAGAVHQARQWWLTFLDAQVVGGRIPDFFTTTGELLPGGYTMTNPYYAQACHALSMDGDVSWFDYTKLVSHISYCETNRKTARGLFLTAEGREGGWDGTIALNPSQTDPGPHLRFEWIGFSCQMYREYLAMAEIARAKGITADVTTYTASAAALKTAIQTNGWDATGQWFFAWDTTVPDFLRRYSADAVFALYAGVASDVQAQTIRNRIMDPGHFLRPYGVTSLDTTDAAYTTNPADQLFNTNWNGPIWEPVQWLAAYGLAKYGYWDDAMEIARRAQLCYKLNNGPTRGERLNPETGAQAGAVNFNGWFGMIALLERNLRANYFPHDITTLPTGDYQSPGVIPVPTSITVA